MADGTGQQRAFFGMLDSLSILEAGKYQAIRQSGCQGSASELGTVSPGGAVARSRVQPGNDALGTVAEMKVRGKNMDFHFQCGIDTVPNAERIRINGVLYTVLKCRRCVLSRN
jgi:hypothetical protein